MRKTLTIGLLLGALLLSLFGNVLAVNAQPCDQLVQTSVPAEETSKEADEAAAEVTEESAEEAEDPASTEESETDAPLTEEEEPAEDTVSAEEPAANLATEEPQAEASTGQENEEKNEPSTPVETPESESNSESSETAKLSESVENSEREANSKSTENSKSTVKSDSTENSELAKNTESQDCSESEENAPLEQENTQEASELETSKPVSLNLIPRVLAQPEAIEAVQTVQEAVEEVAEIAVESFDALKTALKASAKKISIVITKSFEITETLEVGSDKDITLTADNKHQAEGQWKKLEQPADYASAGESKQREIIDQARQRGKEALQDAEAPLPTEEGNIILKRAQDYLSGPLFRVYGRLTLGTVDRAFYLDGNKEATTAIDGGVLFDVEKGGELNLDNGVLMNVNNRQGYSAPVMVKSGGTFNMNGGRISHNQSFEPNKSYTDRPSSGGAVYVKPGGNFNLNNGLIDNNTGSMGAVFAGDLWGSDGEPATINMKGGEIVKNDSTPTVYAYGGGMNLFPKSQLNIKDGIIAGNTAVNGGAIAVHDAFIGDYSNKIGEEWANTSGDYRQHVIKHKTAVNLDGGLIYQNQARYAGGGLFIYSDHVKFGKTMLLDNQAAAFGGAFYVAFPPVTQQLDHVLVTENEALAKGACHPYLGGGDGGGLWNCPTGFDRFGDGHSIYIFNNKAEKRGDDLAFSKKTTYFKLDKVDIYDKFYSHVSPVTEQENLIKFLEDGQAGDSAIPQSLSYTNKMIYLKALYDQALRREAWAHANTFILGNKAWNGGGIGSNGNLVTKEDKGDYHLSVQKNWDASTGGPDAHKDEEVIADIFIVPDHVDEAYVRAKYKNDPKLIKYGEIYLNSKLGWKSSLKDQKNNFNFDWSKYLDSELADDRGLYFSAQALKARGLKYLVMERGQAYKNRVEAKLDDTGLNFTITNYSETPPPENPPENPPKNPPENPPKNPPEEANPKNPKPTPPPILTKALIMKLPVTSCVQAAAGRPAQQESAQSATLMPALLLPSRKQAAITIW